MTREEARQNFVAAAEASYVPYKEIGLHITLGEMSTRLAYPCRACSSPDLPAALEAMRQLAQLPPTLRARKRLLLMQLFHHRCQ